MALSVLNNIPALVTEDQLNDTQFSLKNTLTNCLPVRESIAAPTMRRDWLSPTGWRPTSPR